MPTLVDAFKLQIKMQSAVNRRPLGLVSTIIAIQWIEQGICVTSCVHCRFSLSLEDLHLLDLQDCCWIEVNELAILRDRAYCDISMPYPSKRYALSTSSLARL